MTNKELNKEGIRFATTGQWSEIQPITVLKVCGEDATEFLQGQFSQDLWRDQTGVARYGFWLTRKGRVEGDSTIIRLAEDYCLIFSSSMTAAALVERFEVFLVADDVELVDVSTDWTAWQVMGAEVRGWLKSQEAGGGDSRFAWEAPWNLGRGSAVMVSRSKPKWPIGWREADLREFEVARIGLGCPKVPMDLGPEDFPQEGGLESAGVSFRKGCYLGQEVMARIQNTGRVRRRLVRVTGVGTAPATPDVTGLWQSGKKVGVLRSRVDQHDGRWLGLAMVNLSSADRDRSMTIGETGGDAVDWLTGEDSEAGGSNG